MADKGGKFFVVETKTKDNKNRQQSTPDNEDGMGFYDDLYDDIWDGGHKDLCIKEKDLEYKGKDLGRHWTKSAKDCACVCKDDARCSFFTWRENYCYMKSSIGGRKRKLGAYSGNVNCCPGRGSGGPSAQCGLSHNACEECGYHVCEDSGKCKWIHGNGIPQDKWNTPIEVGVCYPKGPDNCGGLGYYECKNSKKCKLSHPSEKWRRLGLIEVCKPKGVGKCGEHGHSCKDCGYHECKDSKKCKWNRRGGGNLRPGQRGVCEPKGKGCKCNGVADLIGNGGECTDGKNGKWCYVNEHACDNGKKYNGKFYSTSPCKPCVCNGKEDLLGLGGSCKDSDFCYVDEDANCADSSPHNGKTISVNACKGCSCNGDADSHGLGGECTDGKNGRWCYVNENDCDNTKKYNGKFFSTTPCKSEHKKPCVCNGEEDLLGLGGSCKDSDYCYVDKDANCADSSTHNGKTVSKDACKASKQKWPALKTTFKKYNDQPRTSSEAKAAGWKLLSSCEGKFLGHRYANPADSSIVLIYDKAGYIAGTQSVVPLEQVRSSGLDYYNKPAYQLDRLLDQKEAYFTTLYFVDPDLICAGGRSQEDWESQGTGDRLVMQVGDTPDKLQNIPITSKKADMEVGVWYRHLCFPGMGEHYSQFNYKANQDCSSILPLQILFSKGVINGFMWGHTVDLPGDQWEHPDTETLTKIIDRPPSCLEEIVVNPGLSTMHHYFHNDPQLTSCTPNTQRNLASDEKGPKRTEKDQKGPNNQMSRGSVKQRTKRTKKETVAQTEKGPKGYNQ